jgi:threonyl-tRNA synthetase
LQIFDCLDFVKTIYSLFGFSFRMKLSTRPEKFVGDVASWNDAEAALKNALMQYTTKHAGISGTSHTIEVDEGGGAFYGPKIDVFIKDALGREHQCATLQLDFQLPKRFELQYQESDGNHRVPVIIHRAIMGSLERFFGVLIEHTAGKWPFWLSPRQVVVCTVNDRNNDYAASCATQLKRVETDSTQLYVDVDASQRTIPKKVRDAQLSQYNVIALAGDEEQSDGTLTLRFRDSATKEVFTNSWTAVFGCPPKLTSASNTPFVRGAVDDIRTVLRRMQRDLK